jgi:hypothetical protein
MNKPAQLQMCRDHPLQTQASEPIAIPEKQIQTQTQASVAKEPMLLSTKSGSWKGFRFKSLNEFVIDNHFHGRPKN